LSKPRLLFLTSRFPFPLEKGDKLRAYYLIKGLSEYYDIYLFAIHETEPKSKWIEEVSPFCKSIQTGVLPKWKSVLNLIKPSRTPFQVSYFYNESILRQIQDFTDKHKPDILYCHLIRMTEYGRQLNIPYKILDYMDAFSKGMERIKNQGVWWMRIPAYVEWKRLRKYENEVFELFNHKIIISEQDREHIPHVKNQEIQVIVNGVDFEYYKPRESAKKYDLLFNGNMSYPPNIASTLYTAEELLPHIKKTIPSITFLIAGATPTLAIRKLESDSIKVSGWMEDIREAFYHSRVMIAPMLISIGLQNKILQAMAMKIPCVISTMANNALGATHEKEVFVANSPEEYRKYIQLLLTDKAVNERITNAALEFVQNKFNWNQVVKNIVIKIEAGHQA
jgi:polysaccharide biosynthesis protein PslH